MVWCVTWRELGREVLALFSDDSDGRCALGDVLLDVNIEVFKSCAKPWRSRLEDRAEG